MSSVVKSHQVPSKQLSGSLLQVLALSNSEVPHPIIMAVTESPVFVSDCLSILGCSDAFCVVFDVSWEMILPEGLNLVKFVIVVKVKVFALLCLSKGV